MKKIVFLLLWCVLFCGCSALKEYEQEYLDGDKYYDGVFDDAGEEFSDVYMQ